MAKKAEVITNSVQLGLELGLSLAMFTQNHDPDVSAFENFDTISKFLPNCCVRHVVSQGMLKFHKRC